MTKATKMGDPRKLLSIIPDEPAPSDKFGAHSSITEAMISALDRQSSVRLIGLLGRWGTGKSTIIGQLAKTIDSHHKEKYILFTYDAWAHQGDPARRSILEELIERLVGSDQKKGKRWQPMLSAISGSTENASTTSSTQLSAWGKIFFVLLILLPLFLAFIDGDTLRLIFTDSPNGVSRAILIALMIYGVVLGATLAGSYISSMKFDLLKDQTSSFRKRLIAFWSSGEDLLSIVLTRSFPASSSTTLRKSQPTAIEFRRYLRQVVESQQPRRIVFVIDNLDRIDPTEALSLWSIMVGMVSDETHRLNAKIEPIVILPFDPVALERIVPGSGLQGHSASDMIEKSFDITFEVPPPVLSNWRTYFADQYAQCGLQNWTGSSSAELYWTIRCFEKYLGDARITPRRINRFLNRVISLAQQQIERVGPAMLAFYLANEKAIETDCLAFLKSNKPDFAEDNDWQLKIAALAFGTKESEAAQVILGDNLYVALSARKRDAFDGLAKVSGFDEVIRNFVDEPPRNESGDVDARTLNALATYAVTCSADDAVLWSRLWETWKSAPQSDAEDDLLGQAVTTFIDIAPESVGRDIAMVAGRILQQIHLTLSAERQKELVTVGDKLVQLRADPEAILEVDVGTDIALLLSVVEGAAQGSAFASTLRSRSTFKDVADHVIARVEGDIPLFAPIDFRTVERRLEVGQVVGEKAEFFARVGSGLKEIIADVEASDDSLVSAAEILGSRQDNKLRYAAIIGELEDSAELSQAVQKAIQNSSDAVVSALTGLRLTALKMPSSDQIGELASWLGDTDRAVQLLGSIRQLNDGAFLPTLRNLEAAGHDVDPILQPLLTQAVRENSLGKRAHVDWLLKLFDKLAKWLTAEELRTYANLVCGWKEISSELAQLSDSNFLLFISKLPAKAAKGYLGTRIMGVDAKRLAQMILVGDEVWQAYNRIVPHIGSQLSAKSVLYDALHSVMSGSTGALGARAAQRAMKLVQLLNDASRRQLVKSTVSVATKSGRWETIVTLATLDGFSSYISRPKVAAAVIASLYSKLRRPRDGQKFIERHAEAVRQISDAQQAVIARSLSKASKSTDPKTADWARFVIDKAGLKG